MSRFELGKILVTRAVRDQVAPIETLMCLGRHAECDWGDLCREDKDANDRALKEGSRLLSAYEPASVKRRLYIITEADRSHTTILFADEY